MPLTPGVTSVTASSATAISVSATAPSGGSGTYTLQWARSTDGGSTYTNIGGATSSTYTDSSVTNGAMYYYLQVQTDTGVSPNISVSTQADNALAVTPNLSSVAEESVGGIYNSAAPTITSGQSSEFQLDGSGNLKVNVAAGGTSGTQYTDGAVSPAHMVGTVPVFNNAGTVAEVSNSVGLPVNIVAGAGGGLSVTDEAAFTAGASSFVPGGGVFNDSVAALSSGQQGTQRLTPNRGEHVNLRNNAGTEIGTSTNPVQISLANTAANGTAVKVDNSAVTQPVSGTVTANVGTTNGIALDASVTGLQVAQGSTTSGQKGEVIQGAVTTAAPTYTTGQTNPLSLTTTGGLRVDASSTTQPVSAASLPLPAGAGTSANQTTVIANQTNGSQQTKLTDGTNVVAVNSGDVNGLITNINSITTTYTLSGSQSSGTSISGAIDTRGYTSCRIYLRQVGTGVTTITPQISSQSAGTYFTQVSSRADSATVSTQTTIPVNTVGTFNIGNRYLQFVINQAQSASSTIIDVYLTSAPYMSPVQTVFINNGQGSVGTATSGNPIRVGTRAQNAEQTAVTNGQTIEVATDLVGKIITSPFSNKENNVSGTATSTGTSDTSVIAAGAAGVKNYITGASVYNSGASSSVITIKNGSGGSTMWQTIVPAGSGSNFTIVPAVATSTATAVFFASGTASTTVGISLTGYIGT